MTNLDGSNFGTFLADRYIPIAVEVITDPELNSPENVGEYIALAFDKEEDQLTAFLFNIDGEYYDQHDAGNGYGVDNSMSQLDQLEMEHQNSRYDVDAIRREYGF